MSTAIAAIAASTAVIASRHSAAGAAPSWLAFVAAIGVSLVMITLVAAIITKDPRK